MMVGKQSSEAAWAERRLQATATTEVFGDTTLSPFGGRA
jgi:hypothetical protein